MWSHPCAGCQLMPIPAMSSASLKFYLLSSLIFLICAISWSTGMPTRGPNSELTLEEREEIYKLKPPVEDERLGDAEMDNAYDLFKTTKNPVNRRP